MSSDLTVGRPNNATLAHGPRCWSLLFVTISSLNESCQQFRLIAVRRLTLLYRRLVPSSPGAPSLDVHRPPISRRPSTVCCRRGFSRRPISAGAPAWLWPRPSLQLSVERVVWRQSASRRWSADEDVLLRQLWHLTLLI